MCKKSLSSRAGVDSFSLSKHSFFIIESHLGDRVVVTNEFKFVRKECCQNEFTKMTAGANPTNATVTAP
jgi:hypothetical protein